MLLGLAISDQSPKSKALIGDMEISRTRCLLCSLHGQWVARSSPRWMSSEVCSSRALLASLKTVSNALTHCESVYFGNWLRDYSQAVDVGTVKYVSAEAIRLLLWILGFMSFGYGTGEFEVTRDRLG